MISATLKTGSIVVFYWIVAVTLTLTNKYLLGNAYSTDLTLFISWIQCVAAALLSGSIVVGTFIFRPTNPLKISLNNCYDPRLIAVGINLAIVIVLNNLLLKYGGIVFYQSAKFSSIAFIGLFNHFVVRKTLSAATMLACALIIVGFGFALLSDAPYEFTSVGLITAALCSVFVPIQSVMQTFVLEAVETNKVVFILYENFMASVSFLPPIVLFGQFRTLSNTDLVCSWFFWLVLGASGILGLLMSFASLWQLQATSALSSNISSHCKSVFMGILFVLWQQKAAGLSWWASNAVVLVGIVIYLFLRHYENRQQPSPAVDNQPVATVEQDNAVNEKDSAQTV